MADEKVFTSGDVVRLKSGGPLMTVIHTVSREEDLLNVQCTWYSEVANTFSTAAFSENTLDKS